MLKKQLQEELKVSMKSRDELKTSVLRMLISAITYYEIEKGGANYEASETDVLSVIEKQVKQRRDSIEQYKNANRIDLAEKEEKEMELLNIYLPKQLTENEINLFVQDAISQVNAKTIQDIGKIMSVLMPKIKGKADGNIVNKIVREKLNANDKG